MELIHGDCLEEMKNIPDHSVDMILCDLPYGTTACSWDVIIPFELLWEQYKRITKNVGVCCLFGTQPFGTLLIMSNFDNFGYEYIWKKNQVTGIGIANKRPMRSHENIYIFYEKLGVYNKQRILRLSKGGRELAKKGVLSGYHTVRNLQLSSPVPERRYYDPQTLNPQSILEFDCVPNGGGYKLHPTEKPIKLLEYLIRTYTNEGDLVLDNCMGSGSTGVACLNTSRDFIGIELYPLPNKPISKDNPDYFGIAQKRIAKCKFEPINDSEDEQINLF